MHHLQRQLWELAHSNRLNNLSLRGIGRLIGEEDSPNKVKHHLLELEKKGFIKYDQQNKMVTTLKKPTVNNVDIYSIPVVGAADCGPANSFADERTDRYLKISTSILPKKETYFAVRAQGSSMNAARIGEFTIESGDIVIIDKNYAMPVEGDYVLSIIDGAANIKKFARNYKEKEIILYSESFDDYEPIIIHEDDQIDFLINGKVVHVVKGPNRDLIPI